MTRTRRLQIISVFPVALACTALPPGHYYEGPQSKYRNDGYLPQDERQAGTWGQVGHSGHDFCRDVENRARERALDQEKAGWTLGTLALISIGAGTVLTAAQPDKPTTERKIGNASLPVIGAVLGAIAVAVLARGKDADALATSAGTALNLKDKAANETCNTALSTWNTSRAAVDDELVKKLNQASDEIDGGTGHQGTEAGASSDAGSH